MQGCESCKHWWKAKPEGYGICERFDYKCNSDDGKSCLGFERPKFNRNRTKKRLKRADETNP